MKTRSPLTGVAILARVVAQEIDAAACAAAVRHDAGGAVITFAGVVRDHDAGRVVTQLEYSAHPSAELRLREVAEQIAGAHPAVLGLTVVHRIGVLHVGDTALVAAVSAAHRQEAFDACEDLVTRVKQTVPIWKLQTYADGASDWVNCP